MEKRGFGELKEGSREEQRAKDLIWRLPEGPTKESAVEKRLKQGWGQGNGSVDKALVIQA